MYVYIYIYIHTYTRMLYNVVNMRVSLPRRIRRCEKDDGSVQGEPLV